MSAGTFRSAQRLVLHRTGSWPADEPQDLPVTYVRPARMVGVAFVRADDGREFVAPVRSLREKEAT